MTGDTDDVERLRAERDAAVAYAREIEMQLGAMRGRVKRLEHIMWRRTAWRRLWQSRFERLLRKVRRA